MLVSADNFTRAESDLYFGNVVKDGGFGKFNHIRELTPMDKQLVVRSNRDTLYSAGVFDLDAGPVTISLPDPGGRFMSMQVITEDHYVPAVFYGQGEHTLTRDEIGTRYVMVAIRILVNPNDDADLGQVHALQDAIAVHQADIGSFDIPKWDPVSQKTVRDALIQLSATLPDSKGMFGTKSDTDPVRRLIGSATGWGGNPEKDAMYLSVRPANNDGATIYRAHGGPGSGRRVLVGHRLQQRWVLHAQSAKRLFAQQHHRPARYRRQDHHSVRRLRRRDSKLLADHTGMELHSPAVPTARHDPQRRVEIP